MSPAPATTSESERAMSPTTYSTKYFYDVNKEQRHRTTAHIVRTTSPRSSVTEHTVVKSVISEENGSFILTIF